MVIWSTAHSSRNRDEKLRDAKVAAAAENLGLGGFDVKVRQERLRSKIGNPKIGSSQRNGKISKHQNDSSGRKKGKGHFLAKKSKSKL